MFSRRNTSLGLAVWLLVGVVLAFLRNYITTGLLLDIASAILAIVLWPLLLLGIDLTIR